MYKISSYVWHSFFPKGVHNGARIFKFSSTRIFILSLALSLLTIISHVEPTNIQRYHSNLILYGGSRYFSIDQRKVIYTNSEMSNWKNLTHLAFIAGLEEKTLLCGVGHGVWVAYPQEDFKYDKNDKNFVTLIVGDGCLPADNINSVQAITPVIGDDSNLVVFKEPYFTSEAEYVKNDTTSSGVKSFIYPGDHKAHWTVEGGGIKKCVYRPDGLSSPGVCIFPDVTTQMQVDSVTIKPGCEDNKDSSELPEDEGRLPLQTCFGNFGVYRILDNYLKLPVLKSICAGSADEATKFGFILIMDAWKFRMNPEQQEEYNPVNLDKSHKDETVPMRMKLISYFFQIAEAGCPSVNPEYFNVIRFSFMNHIKALWDELPTKSFWKMDDDWSDMFDFLRDCYLPKSVSDEEFTPEKSCITSHPSEGPKQDWEADTIDLFLSGDDLDPVIEQVWMMLSYVGPYCSSRKRFIDNTWMDFVNLFRREVLLPLLQQWANPGTWRTYYEYMFNGYALESGKRKVIACVQEMLRVTPIADPVDRPSAGIDEFANLSKRRPAFITTTTKPRKISKAPKKAAGGRRKRSAGKGKNSAPPPKAAHVFEGKEHEEKVRMAKPTSHKKQRVHAKKGHTKG